MISVEFRALGALAAFALVMPVHADEAACLALSGSKAFAQTQITATKYWPAEAGKSPANCDVTALITPTPGSKITAVYRLPESWNGRMLGIGGGGWAGNVGLQASLPALNRGYATAQTDAGHESANGADVSWVVGNPTAVTDFAHRGVHLMTTTGKRIVASYYGKAAQRNYFQGCSTGGRMGMMETQRYPDDYDGVIAGAPVYNLVVQTMPIVRSALFTAPGAALSPDEVRRVNDAAVAACDAQDGLKDGIVTDPRVCKWDPSELQCPAGGAANGACLSPAQVGALQKAYTTVRTSKGLVGNYALTRGGEAGWVPFVPTTPGPRNPMSGNLAELRSYIFGDANFDQSAFDPEKHQAGVHATPFAKEYEAANPDLKAFFAHGGKLILWHGFDDPGPSPYATIDYFERAQRANGAGSSIRLFLAPGTYHCGGGPGASNFDGLTAMENWVEKGQAPERLLAKNTQAGIERPLCPYPALPRYRGQGDPKSAASFDCR